MVDRSLRVAVIGAGAAGLVAARELRRESHAVVVFERGAAVGGTWVYEGVAPSDSLGGGGGIHSSLYASLRTNLPRECMGFLDFPFAAGAGSVDPRRFPGHAEVLRYLQEFARRFDLLGLIRLETEVVRVRREEDAAAGASWRVVYRSSRKPGTGDSEKWEEAEEMFDAVVVCNGKYSEPRLANIAGIHGWPGKQMHSHSYRVPDPFHGQVVVIIGYNPSGRDISRDIAGVAKEVHVAIRSSPTPLLLPPPAASERNDAYPNLWLHPMIERAEEDGSVVFEDGCWIKADAILHCTGYKYSFPFLGEDAAVSVEDNRVGPLYKHVFPPRMAPRLSFIGLPTKGTSFPQFQLQSKWVAGVLSGRIELPPEEEMTRDVAAFYAEMEARGSPARHTHDVGWTFEYDDWVAERCRCGDGDGEEETRVEEWRKEMHVVTVHKTVSGAERLRDEWDDDHLSDLLARASRDFAKYI